VPTLTDWVLVDHPPTPTLLGEEPGSHRADRAAVIDAAVGIANSVMGEASQWLAGSTLTPRVAGVLQLGGPPEGQSGSQADGKQPMSPGRPRRSGTAPSRRTDSRLLA
jgi:hypothetical protein